jgi:hypothetical protein
MATGYSKVVPPFNQVKEKEFLSRPMGCKGVLQLCALQTRRRSDVRPSGHEGSVEDVTEGRAAKFGCA